MQTAIYASIVNIFGKLIFLFKYVKNYQSIINLVTLCKLPVAK